MKKSIKPLLLAAMAAAALSGCSSKSAPEEPADNNSTTQASSGTEAGNAADGTSYTIGVGQFAEHGSLDNCREGFLQGLAEEGIEEGKNLTVMYENAQADGGTASQIVNNFLSKKVDLICGIATPMAQAAYSGAKKASVPVIFTAVTDPVAAALANEDGTPVGEITGTSDKLPVEKQLEMIRKILPDAKTIGILYSTSEVNSETAIKEYKAAAASYGFEIVEGPVSATADIPLATDSILEKVDCLNNLTDNTVVSSLPLILDKAGKKNIPVFGSEVEQVKIGCLASIGLDYVDLGKQTGIMAAKVLKGEAKASEINFEVIKEAAFYGNSKVAENLGITLPSELTGSAAEIFTEIAH
ncbi:ABC transporter substrate-binding protein [Lacrimispora celerecrescens]|uniref:Putative ABC transport system substrate-binding protein n=1 Tax=[Clostridium] celerecrescens 18A TaxID=1286362 RepID=A0A2M8Z535_9FIRM|nr:ABC transporter substrate-binding protein [Lacrimispora celerecrescens]PJJ28552.1 putative ABC transport system substrate-binding protein [[Clostridium] celerecrescens 18A]